jgi:bifunctional ADP-heptose synthase (sugar kinase/adenylyltransferase)
MYYSKNFIHNKISVDKFKKQVNKFYTKSDLMLVIDFGFNFLDANLIKFINNFDFSVNVHSNSINKNFNNASKYKKSIYSTLNLSEYLFDRRLQIENNPNKILDYIKKKEKKDNFSITLGKKGSIFKKKGKIIHCPSFFNYTKDTTGSGDAYFAITALLNRLNLEPDLIAFLGNIYAGLHANIVGNKSFVSSEDLVKNIKILLS